MPSTLALAKKEQPKKPDENEKDYEDRIVEDTYWKLREIKKRLNGKFSIWENFGG